MPPRPAKPCAWRRQGWVMGPWRSQPLPPGDDWRLGTHSLQDQCGARAAPERNPLLRVGAPREAAAAFPAEPRSGLCREGPPRQPEPDPGASDGRGGRPGSLDTSCSGSGSFFTLILAGGEGATRTNTVVSVAVLAADLLGPGTCARAWVLVGAPHRGPSSLRPSCPHSSVRLCHTSRKGWVFLRRREPHASAPWSPRCRRAQPPGCAGEAVALWQGPGHPRGHTGARRAVPPHCGKLGRHAEAGRAVFHAVGGPTPSHSPASFARRARSSPPGPRAALRRQAPPAWSCAPPGPIFQI